MSSGKASLTAVIGATGSGKSLWLKRHLLRKKPKRLLVWDPRREYENALEQLQPEVTSSLDALGRRLIEGGSLRVIYQPPGQADPVPLFDHLCKLAFAAGRLVLVAEELSDVTKPGWSPPGWRQCVTQGRHAQLEIIGTSQRPQLLDKTFLDQCTTLRVGRLNTLTARRMLADSLGMHPSELDLRPLEWISRDLSTGKTARETLSTS